MDIKAYLKENGYLNSHPNPVHRDVIVHYKKMPLTIKHQLEVEEWPSSLMGRGPSFVVTMTYETQFGGAWATTKFYGLNGEQLIKTLYRLEVALKESMVYMGANPQHYRIDGED